MISTPDTPIKSIQCFSEVETEELWGVVFKATRKIAVNSAENSVMSVEVRDPLLWVVVLFNSLNNSLSCAVIINLVIVRSDK
jgi:hypothetical protein